MYSACVLPGARCAPAVSEFDSNVSSMIVACAARAVDGVALWRFGGGVHSLALFSTCGTWGLGRWVGPVTHGMSLSVSVMNPSVSSFSPIICAHRRSLGVFSGVARSSLGAGAPTGRGSVALALLAGLAIRLRNR